MLHPHCVSSSVSVKPTCGWWCRQAADVITSLGKKTYFYHWAQSIPSCPTYLWNRIKSQAARETSPPHVLHLPLRSPYRNTAPFKAHFASWNVIGRKENSCFSICLFSLWHLIFILGGDVTWSHSPSIWYPREYQHQSSLLQTTALQRSSYGMDDDLGGRGKHRYVRMFNKRKGEATSEVHESKIHTFFKKIAAVNHVIPSTASLHCWCCLIACCGNCCVHLALKEGPGWLNRCSASFGKTLHHKSSTTR